MEIVKPTAPVLEEHDVVIASHFYARLLQNRPDFKNIFNMTDE
jgi:nitric oxide dioxygenase